ncbi:MAG TPA: hypothetical protein VFT55_12365, partial [Planctomycetota bacterium]|nr:hypothetical protein [Planctomycetota bacterium]
VAQSGSLVEPRLSGPLAPIAAAQLPHRDPCERSALDNEPKSADPVVVPFRQINQPPIVKAGPDVATVITSAAHVAGAADDDGLPGRLLAVHWSQVAGPGTASFAGRTQPATDISFSVAGSYTLELSAFDGEFTSTDTVVVTVQELPVILELAMTTGNDDVEQSSTKVDRSSKSLEMVMDGTMSQVVGLRFQGVTIPRGASISSAYVQFAAEKVTSTPARLRISGEASDNAAAFNPAHSLSSRPATRADVTWAPAAWRIPHEEGPDQRTPNLKNIVQEVTSRPGWNPGNSMVLTITGTGCRTATSYEKRRASAAKLVVTYHE